MRVDLEHKGCGGEVLMRLYPPCLFGVEMLDPKRYAAAGQAVPCPYVPVGEPIEIEEGDGDGGLYCVDCHTEDLLPHEVEVTGTTSRLQVEQQTATQV